MKPISKIESLTEIRSRRIIRVGFALVMFVIFFIVAFGIFRLDKVRRSLSTVLAHEQVAIEMLFRMQQSARDRSVLLYRVASTVDPFERDELLLKHGQMGGEFNLAREALTALTLDVTELALLKSLKEYVDKTHELQAVVRDELALGHLKRAQEILNKQATPSQGKMLDSISQFLQYEIDQSHGMGRYLKDHQWQAQLLMMLAGLIAFVCVLLVYYFISRSMNILISGLASTTHNLQESNHNLAAFKSAIDHHSIVSVTDVHGNITYVNDKFCEISQYTAEELIGQNHRLLNSGMHPHSFFVEMWATISAGQVWQGEVCNLRKNGSRYWVSSTIVPFLDEAGRPYKYISTRTDITATKEAERVLIRDKLELEKLIQERTEELQCLANTDVLTGLYNRRYFNNAMYAELARAKRYGTPFALIIFDIDFFKRVNDVYGHQAGDEVLVKIALLATNHIRDVDVLARWGGEEFAILTMNGDVRSAYNLAENLRVLITSFSFTDVGQVTCSFGVTEFREGDDLDALLKRADKNMYLAKEAGRNNVVFE
jgi:diguanylate cyclase (GGDEF)-like protein/PAS domain S-box-containing protein